MTVRTVEDKPASDWDESCHLAGIIPLCGQQYRKRKLPWHPALLPVAEACMLIDMACMQCAYAGCETIWIVADDYLEPYLKKHIGEWIHDPIYYGVNPFHTRDFGERSRRIPIFIVPEDGADRNKRDSISFQAIRGMEMARKITGQITTYIIPDKYFVTWPYSLFNYKFTREHRVVLSSEQDCIFTHDGKSIATGHYLPFTCTLSTAKLCKDYVWKNATGIKDMSQPKEEWQWGSIPTEVLPPEERYNGRWWGPDQVFKVFHEKKDNEELELNWFYDASTFEGYREYMRSDNFMYNVSRKLFKRKTWNSMSFDDEEFKEEE